MVLLKLSNTLPSFLEGYLKIALPIKPGGNISFHSLSFRQLSLSTTSIKRVPLLIPQALQIYKLILGLFLVAQLGKKSTCNVGDWVQPLGWEDPLEKGKDTHSSILAWRILRSV